LDELTDESDYLMFISTGINSKTFNGSLFYR
jgi:hypothetical protein